MYKNLHCSGNALKYRIKAAFNNAETLDVLEASLNQEMCIFTHQLPGFLTTDFITKYDGNPISDYRVNTLPQPQTKFIQYTVKKGDYLSKIGQKYKVSVANIMLWNKLTDDIIHPGDVLTIFIISRSFNVRITLDYLSDFGEILHSDVLDQMARDFNTSNQSGADFYTVAKYGESRHGSNYPQSPEVFYMDDNYDAAESEGRSESEWVETTKKFGHGMEGFGVGLAKTVPGTFRLTNGAYNGSKFSPKYYADYWKGHGKARISTYSVGKLGKGISEVAGVASTGIAYYELYKGSQDPMVLADAGVGTMGVMSSFATYYAGIEIPYIGEGVAVYGTCRLVFDIFFNLGAKYGPSKWFTGDKTQKPITAPLFKEKYGW